MDINHLTCLSHCSRQLSAIEHEFNLCQNDNIYSFGYLYSFGSTLLFLHYHIAGWNVHLVWLFCPQKSTQPVPHFMLCEKGVAQAEWVKSLHISMVVVGIITFMGRGMRLCDREVYGVYYALACVCVCMTTNTKVRVHIA